MTNLVAENVHVFICRVLCLGVGVLLLGGCAILPASNSEETAEGTGENVLALGWEAISDWQPVNLDGDEQEEHLLLFRFDNGQVGALILEGNVATSISTPDNLLPRYFDDQGALGQGVIASPGTPASAIAITQVDGDIPPKELVILGGSTHLTIAWWKGEGNGYGVTQLYAPGGFGVDWETWKQDPAPLANLMGYYPLTDYRARANICELVFYTRRTDLPSHVPMIVYSAEPLGMHFCNSKIPPRPFAPEAVVMAYLRWSRPGDSELEKLLTPGTTLPQLDAESASERWSIEQIADIAAYPSVPMNTAQVTGAQQGGDVLAPTTTVCVEFAEIANPVLRRWVVYTLRYQPPNAAQKLSDRWTVSGARTEPPPMEPPPPGYCTTILDRNAP